MEQRKRRVDITREEKKKQLLKFIERKKVRNIPLEKMRSPLHEDSKEQVPSVNKENVPRETETTYIEGSNRRKKRREKLQQIKEKRDEVKKKRALAIQEKKQRREEERRRAREEQQKKKLEALKKKEEVRQLKEAKRKEAVEKKKEEIRKRKEARLLQEAKRKEAAEKKRADALKRQEEIRQSKEAKRKEKIKIIGTGKPPIKVPLTETSKRPATSSINNNKKKEELLALINKIKEKHQLEYTQRLLQKQVATAEKKLKIERAREEQQKKKLEALKKKEEVRQLKEAKRKEAVEKKKEEIRKREEARLLQEAKRKEAAEKKRAEALKRQEEIRQLKEAKRKEALLQKEKKTTPVKKVIPAEEKERPSAVAAPTPYTKRKEELQEFLRTRKVLYEQEKERKKVLKQLAIEKKKVRVIPPEEKKEVIVPVKTIEKIREEVLPALITAKIYTLSKEARRTEKEAKDSISISSGNIKHFISTFTKKKKERVEKPVPAVLEKKAIAKYKEPFLLMPFIRRNIFKFVFLILLIAWLYEILFFMGRFQDPQKRLSDIVGEDVSKEKPAPSVPVKEEKLPVTEAEFKIALKKEKIDIEGKRDPFSPGRLTMEVFEKPGVTSIVLASKPEVISILRPSRVVSILREEKKMEPEKVSAVSKPQAPSYQPILKDMAPSKVQPIEKPAETTSLIMPEKRCDLIYRGRLVIEGVEYLFIEGKNKTYRVTIGDVVEGFRILRKEKDKLYLSKEGIIYEIPVD